MYKCIYIYICRLPIWVVGSDSHFTVLIRHKKYLLTCTESRYEYATRIFNRFDIHNNGFIVINDMYAVLVQVAHTKLFSTLPYDIYVHVHMFIYVYIRISVYICLCIYAFSLIYTRTYISVYTYIYI